MNIINYVYTLFTVAYGIKFTKPLENDDTLKLWLSIWKESLICYSNEIIAKSAKQCTLTLHWPPSLAEFIQVCNKHAGIPTVAEIIQLCVRHELEHPIVKEIYDAIGSWSFRTDSAAELEDKISKIYPDVVNKYNDHAREMIGHRNNIKLVDSDAS